MCATLLRHYNSMMVFARGSSWRAIAISLKMRDGMCPKLPYRKDSSVIWATISLRYIRYIYIYNRPIAKMHFIGRRVIADYYVLRWHPGKNGNIFKILSLLLVLNEEHGLAVYFPVLIHERSKYFAEYAHSESYRRLIWKPTMADHFPFFCTPCMCTWSLLIVPN